MMTAAGNGERGGFLEVKKVFSCPFVSLGKFLFYSLA